MQNKNFPNWQNFWRMGHFAWQRVGSTTDCSLFNAQHCLQDSWKKRKDLSDSEKQICQDWQNPFFASNGRTQASTTSLVLLTWKPVRNDDCVCHTTHFFATVWFETSFLKIIQPVTSQTLELMRKGLGAHVWILFSPLYSSAQVLSVQLWSQHLPPKGFSRWWCHHVFLILTAAFLMSTSKFNLTLNWCVSKSGPDHSLMSKEVDTVTNVKTALLFLSCHFSLFGIQ